MKKKVAKKKKLAPLPTAEQQIEASMWSMLASAWFMAEKSALSKEYRVEIVNDRTSIGLCDSITQLRYAVKIDFNMSQRMVKRLRRNRPVGTNMGDYFWPHDKRGANARARFCLKMADLALKSRS